MPFADEIILVSYVFEHVNDPKPTFFSYFYVLWTNILLSPVMIAHLIDRIFQTPNHVHSHMLTCADYVVCVDIANKTHSCGIIVCERGNFAKE